MTAAAPLQHLRRVVVTGMGAVTPLGLTLEDSWKNLLQNQSGATTLTQALQWQPLTSEQLEQELEYAAQLPCQVAAPVKWKNEDRKTARFVQLALQASRESLESARLDDDWFSERPSRRHRAGVCIGSGMSSVREILQAFLTPYRQLSPHFVPKVLSNSASGRVSLEWQLQGPNCSPATACAAGTHAIGEAFQCIQYGLADLMVAGGAEACIDPLSLAGFCRLRALSTSSDPQTASRPFDEDRNGFVLAEGAAILILEELEHAIAREAPILAEVVGFGMSGDAHHVTAPDPEGRGAERAMRMALADTDLGDVGYVNAHATSTPKGDEIEAAVIDRVFEGREDDNKLFVSSTKGATGHLLGAAGALEAAFTVLALHDFMIPPTLKLQTFDAPVHFCHVTDRAMSHNLQAAMNNSFGFGGTNASLVFARAPAS